MTPHLYRRWCTTALLLLTAIAIFCFIAVARSGLQIDTNLRSLSPAFSADSVVNQALNKMSAAAGQKFMLVLVHKDEDVVADASDSLRDMIDEQVGSIRYVDQSGLLDAYLDVLKQHPFNILGVQARSTLAQANDEKILALGEHNLYGASGMLRTLPVTSDPFGFANEYAVGLLDRMALNSSDDVRAVTRNGTTQYISVHMLQLTSYALEMKQQDAALTSIKKITTQLTEQYPAIEILQSGILFFAAAAAQSAKADINTITTGSMLGILLLILWVFRGPRALLLPVLSIASGLVFAFSLCHFWFGSIHVLTLVFGASLIGVVVDYALHFYYFHAHHPNSNNPAPLYRALLLSLLTSVIGFSALAWSGLAALQQVAIFAALGLVYAWLMVIVMGQYLTRGVRVYDSGLQLIVRALLNAGEKIRSRWLIAGIALLLVSGFAVRGFDLPVSDSPRSFFAVNSDLLAQEKQVSEWVSTHEPASFILVQGETAQQVYDRIAQVQEQVLNAPAAGVPSSTLFLGVQLLGVQQFFPSPLEQQDNFQRNKQLYSTNGLVGEFIRRQGLSEISQATLLESYRQQKNTYINPADFFSRTNLPLPPLWIDSADSVYAFLLIPKGADTAALARNIAALDGVSFFSAMDDAEQSMRLLRISAMELLCVALGLMALLVLSRYGWKKMLQLIAIPVFAVLSSYMLLALLNIPLSVFHVMALFLVVGLGMDYVIFIAEMRDNALETLSAIALSSITNLLSFGLLSLSVLPAVSAFGSALFIGCCCNLLGALLLASRAWQKTLIC
jgi:predicted exporter